MSRLGQQINIPTELLRSAVAVAEEGSYAKAAERLGLSQPAVSSQIKRLQKFVGSPVFERTSSGKLALTSKGKVVVALARKLLESSERILAFGRGVDDPQRLRVGLTTNYAEYLLSSLTGNEIAYQIQITTGYSAELAHILRTGDLDIACLADAPPDLGEPSFSWIEEFAWVCSRSFVFEPDRPIPLVACEGVLGDQMIGALERAGLAFTVAFSSADHNARVMATSAGMGLMSLPRRHVREPMIVATKFSLPPMSRVRMDVMVRPGIEPAKIAPLMKLLKALAPANFRRSVKK
jgi:DNA-binding transcriptional LysR family regulator